MVDTNWGIEVWGPELAKVWGSIKDRNNRAIKAYGFSEIPETISVIPCAISFLFEPIDVDYSAGGKCLLVYRGKTEFFLSTDVKKNQLNLLFPYIRKIVETAAKNLTLQGKVESFLLAQTGGISPAILTYGDAIDRYGLVVTWEIREDVTSKINVTA